MRDIARVLHVSPTTVIQELKKTRTPQASEPETPTVAKPESVEVRIAQVEESKETCVDESELDEMWSYVGEKSNPR